MTDPIHNNKDNPFAAPAPEVLEEDPESNSESSQRVRASSFKRVVAGILDLFIGGFLVAVAFILTAGLLVTLNDSTNNLPIQYRPLILIPLALIPWLYFAVLETTKIQGTFSKHLLGIQVARPDGSRISLGQASSRLLFKTLVAGFFAFFLVLAPILTLFLLPAYLFIAGLFYIRKKMTFNDFVTKTRVFQKQSQLDAAPKQTPSDPEK